MDTKQPPAPPTRRAGRPWREVPMPPAVAALPRTPSGMPVPYITQYHAKDVESNTGTLRVTEALGMMDCRCTFGEGVPRIGKQCPRRQRKAMAERRCNVCGHHMKNAALNLIGVYRQHIPVLGSEVYASVEASTHADCVTYSALTCPRLADVDRIMVAVTRHADMLYQVTMGVDPVSGVERRRYVHPDNVGSAAGLVDMLVIVPDPARSEFVTLAEWLDRYSRPLERKSLRALYP